MTSPGFEPLRSSIGLGIDWHARLLSHHGSPFFILLIFNGLRFEWCNNHNILFYSHKNKTKKSLKISSYRNLETGLVSLRSIQLKCNLSSGLRIFIFGWCSAFSLLNLPVLLSVPLSLFHYFCLLSLSLSFSLLESVSVFTLFWCLNIFVSIFCSS